MEQLLKKMLDKLGGLQVKSEIRCSEEVNVGVRNGTTFEIKGFSESHMLCVVTTRRGYSYACTWALERNDMDQVISPTIEELQRAWYEDKSDFDRYNGIYCF